MALLAAVEADSQRAAALVTLLALNGLRVSEALEADVMDLGTERGIGVLHVRRKGGKRATVALAPRTAGAIDTYLDGRDSGPLFTTSTGGRFDRGGAYRLASRLARQAGSRPILTASATAPSRSPWIPGCLSVTFRTSPVMPTPGRPAATTIPDTTSTGRPRSPSLPLSGEFPGGLLTVLRPATRGSRGSRSLLWPSRASWPKSRTPRATPGCDPCCHYPSSLSFSAVVPADPGSEHGYLTRRQGSQRCLSTSSQGHTPSTAYAG